jgi:cobalamin biosynthesis protein CobT
MAEKALVDKAGQTVGVGMADREKSHDKAVEKVAAKKAAAKKAPATKAEKKAVETVSAKKAVKKSVKKTTKKTGRLPEKRHAAKSASGFRIRKHPQQKNRSVFSAFSAARFVDGGILAR